MLLLHATSLIQLSLAELSGTSRATSSLNSFVFSSFSYHILTLPSIPPVTNLFGTSDSAFSLIAGFMMSLFSARRRHGSVDGPQLKPFIPPL
jgi:hypothetical protein